MPVNEERLDDRPEGQFREPLGLRAPTSDLQDLAETGEKEKRNENESQGEEESSAMMPRLDSLYAVHHATCSRGRNGDLEFAQLFPASSGEGEMKATSRERKEKKKNQKYDDASTTVVTHQPRCCRKNRLILVNLHTSSHGAPTLRGACLAMSVTIEMESGQMSIRRARLVGASSKEVAPGADQQSRAVWEGRLARK
ncbi:uncharacterized protein N7459_003474 [Penicillium hispanicum]|uniref:uncharacterized protein n=1 Tax=Penicillium hispanicum TaxID=1080232 RepID=UPI002540E5A1|nr:uncharacterized protein N7459_003474 [Penicillium hispanicum]KAJ5587709.1 hypothetical protein N7459_003474 [Penicillium hispanicum]